MINAAMTLMLKIATNLGGLKLLKQDLKTTDCDLLLTQLLSEYQLFR